ncbi:hypothetical protein [Paenibacillus sp. FSL H7-0331]|uniref:hypothetical protein n=1 Tax=Paenibacillus sp. FSL H7-0331 TaxID=1920421 RepID=UPI0021160509|nr:hypothetical protein [Paenibacillus sp. FSL H7-0331]
MKITEVIIRTHRFDAMKAFYGSLLGLDILEDQQPHLSFQAGESILSFRESSPTENPFYHVASII